MKTDSKKKQTGGESLWNVFITTMVASFGALGSFMILGLFSLATIGLGIWLIKRNAKEDPKTGKVKINWNVVSGFGAFLIALGFIPWLPWLFQGFMFNLGAILSEVVIKMIFPDS